MKMNIKALVIVSCVSLAVYITLQAVSAPPAICVFGAFVAGVVLSLLGVRIFS